MFGYPITRPENLLPNPKPKLFKKITTQPGPKREANYPIPELRIFQLPDPTRNPKLSTRPDPIPEKWYPNIH